MTTRKAILVVAVITSYICAGCVSSLIDSFTGDDATRDIRANGLSASGKVLKIWETGVRVNDNPVVGFLLEIHAEGLEPYEAETKALISIPMIPNVSWIKKVSEISACYAHTCAILGQKFQGYLRIA